MINDLTSYCLHLSSSQGMLYLRSIRGNYDTMLILRGVTPSIRPYVVTRGLIQIPQDGVL